MVAVRISETGLALVMAFEGCLKPVPGKAGFFKPYTCPAGVLTIGWGHTNHHAPTFSEGTVWSQRQCDDALRGDLARFERIVARTAAAPLAQHEFDALVSWAYNTGGPSSAGVWRALRAGRRRDVAAELAKWNRGGGLVLAGLVRRRKAEGLLFDGRIEEALRVAGARPPAAGAVSPSAPPDVAPAPPVPPKSWLGALVSRFRKA